jgi:hypothetical protein
MGVESVPGFEGTSGPFGKEQSKPHVYARDIHSGAGNCVCGNDLGHLLHTEAAPGVSVPYYMRPGWKATYCTNCGQKKPEGDIDWTWTIANGEILCPVCFHQL